MKITVDLQIATEAKNIPTQKQFETWANAALKDYPKNVEICIRIVDEKEIQQLNSTYRQKNYPTNILSFPYEDSELLGDIAICAFVIQKEAKEQHISLESHWAHIVIHGCLHLIDYTHDANEDAEEMEALEIRILAELPVK